MLANLANLVNRLSAAEQAIKFVKEALWDEANAVAAETPMPGSCRRATQSYPCVNCGKDMGINQPSGVCSAKCKREAESIERWLHSQPSGGLAERVENLTRIVLEISPDVCAKHDLFPF